MWLQTRKIANLFEFDRYIYISRGYDFDAASVDVMLELELYDMVSFGKSFDAADRETHNHFQGWLIL